jgi:hypothetical protein
MQTVESLNKKNLPGNLKNALLILQRLFYALNDFLNTKSSTIYYINHIAMIDLVGFLRGGEYYIDEKKRNAISHGSNL